jgi:carbamoyl-phosphate synthase large subunit
MAVAFREADLRGILARAAEVSGDHPVVMSRFITGAKEIEIDAVATRGEMVAFAISEHVENAGVHSGDATMVLPPQKLYLETIRRIKRIARRISAALEISGPFNIQFLARDNRVRVIECNLRASRSFPFCSKIYNVDFIEVATRAIMGWPVEPPSRSLFELDYVGVKAPQFSFTRLIGADPKLGVEMASTGEVACLGVEAGDAYLKSFLSAGNRLPRRAILLSTGPIESKAGFLESARVLQRRGIRLHCTGGTADFLQRNGVPCEVVAWPLDDETPDALDLIRNGDVDLVINIPKDLRESELTNGYLIRRHAVDFGVPLITNLQLANLLVDAIDRFPADQLECRPWESYVTA